MTKGIRPTHEGNVTVKDGDNWKKIGDCAVWVNPDDSISGVITVKDGEGKEVKTNFRAWKR